MDREFHVYQSPLVGIHCGKENVSFCVHRFLRRRACEFSYKIFSFESIIIYVEKNDLGSILLRDHLEQVIHALNDARQIFFKEATTVVDKKRSMLLGWFDFYPVVAESHHFH